MRAGVNSPPTETNSTVDMTALRSIGGTTIRPAQGTAREVPIGVLASVASIDVRSGDLRGFGHTRAARSGQYRTVPTWQADEKWRPRESVPA
jgi:hypothetical protein